MFLESWIEPICFDEVCIEVAAMNVEDSVDVVKNHKEIFMYWSLEERKFYYGLMLQD